ncbi:Sodium-dependent dicarboxylate transporter SdcS [Rubripirellula lacrimiformis]|uniref:Sodium-dependent dicarboxylate transporter SdcS n=1 Tax=Rubripirellula lacrimiformis TaxID=1930273 RepID=A0A517N439_9BACT|nr:SLC13 family permease [Rubripirellula lacrimiformis]QDT01909.1 Sodium-dependent dicarboxylate transporter SdcS [Rubripirellula lacrimiformis]
MGTWEPWLAIAVALTLLITLAMRVAATDLLAVGCLAILVVAQSITGTPLLPSPEAAVAGFGNQGLITIAFLFAVVTGLEFTGGTELATGWFLNRAKTLTGAQSRLLIPVALMSGFLNNTPVVVALMPVVSDLAKRIGTSSSRLLLPLSYAAILGGMCTLMGTSTNLLIADLNAKEIAAGADITPLSFFAPAAIGIPATVIGLIYMIVASRWLLPDRRGAISVSDDPRQYTVEVQVEAGGPLAGRTIEDAGLRHLPGLYIAEIQREDGTIAAAKPTETLRGNDVLILVGALDSVVDLRKIRGLTTSDDQARKLQIPAWQRTLVEAVVSPRCGLLGKTIREGKFRSHYNAAVVAVARGDKRLTGKLGDVRLETGDVLLLEASPSFLHRRGESRDFFLVSTVQQGAIRRPERAWHAIAVVLVMVAVAAMTQQILTASLVAAIAMIALRCCTTSEARRSIDWSILIVIGAAIGIGSAMHQSGAAAGIASGLLNLAGGNPLLTLAALYLATMFCTELITNNAAAMLMFHIANSAAAGLGCDPAPMIMAVMIAASASFLTPFGYQTNMMVYGVGGYRVSDYLKFGMPLSLIVFVVAMTVIPIVWPLS